MLKDYKDSYLLSGVGTGVSASGRPVDTRNAANNAYLMYVSYSPSAILQLEVSHDATGWMPALIVTATPTTGTAQISAYYPYVRGVYSTGWSTTASAVMFYSPRVI